MLILTASNTASNASNTASTASNIAMHKYKELKA